jgi:hypothetical protein
VSRGEFGDPPQTTLVIWAHPCRVTLNLEVDGEPVAAATVCPEYEWLEPNGVGCGWIGVARVALAPDRG